jgi:hypothetical protein
MGKEKYDKVTKPIAELVEKAWSFSSHDSLVYRGFVQFELTPTVVSLANLMNDFVRALCPSPFGFCCPIPNSLLSGLSPSDSLEASEPRPLHEDSLPHITSSLRRYQGLF